MAKSKRKSTGRRSKKSASASKSNTWLWVAIAVAVVLVGVVGFVLFKPADMPAEPVAPAPAEISVDEAYAKYEAGAFLLDVRTPEEWVEYHAPNTTLIPLDELEARVNEVPTDQEVVVVCRSGNRSQVGRDILIQAGHPQVSSMAGGLKTWREAGYPITSGQ
jgi:rhodanese-related sulfurtransferase